MINKITKEQYPDIWDSIVDDIHEITNQEHRRGSNFYANLVFCIDAEFFPNNPELYGYWMSKTIIWDSEYGMDDEIKTLSKVELKEKTVVTKEWEIVK